MERSRSGERLDSCSDGARASGGTKFTLHRTAADLAHSLHSHHDMKRSIPYIVGVVVIVGAVVAFVF